MGMKFEILPKSLAPIHYPYRVAITHSVSPYEHAVMVKLEEVEEWARDINFECIITTNTGYFHTEADATFFILRWA